MSHQLGMGDGKNMKKYGGVLSAVLKLGFVGTTVPTAGRRWTEVKTNGNSDQRDHQRDGHHRGAGHERGVYRCAWQKRQVERMMSFFRAESVLIWYREIVR